MKNLPRSKFLGFHIHANRSCTGDREDEFKDVGKHYNPDRKRHPNHKGDLSPINTSTGEVHIEQETDRFTVDEIIGKAIILHSQRDDFTSQPAGDAGDKIACGVIREMKLLEEQETFDKDQMNRAKRIALKALQEAAEENGYETTWYEWTYNQGISIVLHQFIENADLMIGINLLSDRKPKHGYFISSAELHSNLEDKIGNSETWRLYEIEWRWEASIYKAGLYNQYDYAYYKTLDTQKIKDKVKSIIEQGKKFWNSSAIQKFFKKAISNTLTFRDKKLEENMRSVLDESKNPLKDAEEFAKKHQKGLGAFVKLNAGNVEKGMETFNKNMGDSASTGTGEAQGGSMSESKNLKEASNGRLPAWSKESAEVTNNSFDTPQSVHRVIKSFDAKNANYTRRTQDDGAVVAKYLTNRNTIDVTIPEGAYVVVKWKDEGTYPSPIAIGCYAWDGRFWYYIDFEKEDIIPDDYFENVSNSGNLTYYLYGLIDYFEDRDEYDFGLVSAKLKEVAPFMKDDDIQEIRKELNNSSFYKKVKEDTTRINIREELNKIDMNTCKTDLVNMYEACNLTNEDKKQLVTLLKENKIEDLNKFLESKLFEDSNSNTSVRDALKLLVDKFGNNKHKYKATADSFYDGSGWEGDIREFTFFAPNDYIAAFSLVLHQAPTIANFEAAEITGDEILNYMNQFESADDIAYELGTDGLAGNEDIIIDLTNTTTGNNLFQHDTEDSYDSDEYDDYDWDDDMDESLNEATDDYSEEDLKMFASMIRVNSPRFRGDPYPPFAETKINESNIPDTMRFKNWDIDVIDKDTLQLKWVTQEDFTDEESEIFIKEIRRAIEALSREVRFDQPFTVALTAQPRGFSYGDNSLVIDLDFDPRGE